MPRNGPETSGGARATDRRMLLRGAGIGSAAMALSALPSAGGGLLGGAARANDQRVSDYDILNFALNPAPPWFPRPRT